MQLLQKLRDSSIITVFTRSLEEIERIAREHYHFIRDFLKSSFGRPLLLVYTGLGNLPANVVYWYMLTMCEEQYVVISEAQTASLYILPYREKTSILAFGVGDHSLLIDTVRVVRLLGHDIWAIMSKLGDDRVETLSKGLGILIIPLKNELDASLAMAISSFMALTEVFRERFEARGRRLFEHSLEGFTAISESLIEKYMDVLENILSRKKIIVTSSKLMETSSVLLTYVLKRSGIDAYYIPFEILNTIDVWGDILVVATSVEEKMARNLKYKLSRSGSGIVDLVLNTDPLEANIYLSTLAYYIEKLRSSVTA
ncbi:MAG: hypothetical protein QXP02_02785 [Desulfurococcaceae archaeon]